MASERDERRQEVLATVGEAMRNLTDDATADQLDLVMLAAGFNPQAVRSFARVLLRQESTTMEKPPLDVDAGVKWARSHLAAAVDDLFAAGGTFQVIMLAAQTLPSYVAEKQKAKAEAEKDEDEPRRKRPTPGNGVQVRADEG